MLDFRCEYCELDFQSEPDGTGYEQAPCPKCGHLSMTREYLDSENRPIRIQFSLGSFLLVLILVTVVTLCCLPIWHRHPGYGGIRHGHPIWEWGHMH